MWTANQSIECFLLAFDIVSFSRNLENADGLFLDRKALMDAIKATALFPEMVKQEAVFVQFLGDEFRVAFRAGKTSEFSVTTFAEQIYQYLERLDKKAPTIRGVMLQGVVSSREFLGYTYLDGDVVYQAANLLAHSQEGHVLSSQKIHGWAAVDHGWQKKFSDRTIKNTDQIQFRDNSNSSPFFIFACAIKGAEPSGALTAQLRTIIDNALTQTQGNDDIKKVRCSISPNGIIVAFRDDVITKALEFLHSLEPHASTVTGFAAAFSKGKLRTIEKEPWLSENFEGGEAIVTCRILAKLGSGDFAYTESVKTHKEFKPAVAQVFFGKRGEEFKAYLMKGYFSPSLPTRPLLPKSPLPTTPTAYQQDFSLNASPIDAILNAAKEMAPSESDMFTPVALAMMFSGLTPVLAEPRQLGVFSLSSLSKVIGVEIAMWKEFHSVLGPLSRYCETACTYLRSTQKRAKGNQFADKRLEQILDGFNTISHDGAGDFSTHCLRLRDAGYSRLVQSLRTFADVFGVSKASSAYSTLLASDYGESEDCFGAVSEAVRLLSEIRDNFIRALPSNARHTGLLKAIVLNRTRAAGLALEFSAGLLLLEKYFNGYFVERERANPTLCLLRDARFKAIEEKIKLQKCDLVVSSSNSVIFNWIDLLMLIRPNESGTP